MLMPVGTVGKKPRKGAFGRRKNAGLTGNGKETQNMQGYRNQNAGNQPGMQPGANGYGWNQGESGFQNNYPQSGPAGYGAAPQNYQQYAPQQGYQSPQQGYQAPQQGYPQYSQGYAPAQQGYPGAMQGYSGQMQGYPTSQNAYPQSQPVGTDQGYAPNYQGYPPQYAQGYPQSTGSRQPYSYPNAGYGTGSQPPQAGTAAGGSYIPQTPYSQGNPSGTYPVSEPSGGYPPYPQMAPPPAGNGYPSSSIPLNGSGYVPQKVQTRKQPFRVNDVILAVLSVVLLALFGAGMFAPGLGMLKWAFLAPAVLSVAFFWVKPVIEGNKRLCYTIVFGALTAVVLFSMLNPGKGGTTTNPNGNDRTAAAQQTTGAPQSQSIGSSVVDGQSGQPIDSVAASTGGQTTPETDAEQGADVVDRLKMFFQYWRANQTDEMLTLCMPSWKDGQENPKAALFQLMGNRKIVDEIVPENITGTVNDESRTVTIQVLMDRNNGKPSSKYRLNVRMVKESNEWYVDPQSLKSYESAETTDPASVTPTPTAEPQYPASTVLYYNLDGGTKYHLDPNCKSLHKKYLPMKGTFTYGQINDPPYDKLKPCNVCGAPLR